MRTDGQTDVRDEVLIVFATTVEEAVPSVLRHMVNGKNSDWSRL